MRFFQLAITLFSFIYRFTSLCFRAYFAVNLLNVINELLDDTKQDDVLIIGCQTLSTFIYHQVIYEIQLYFFTSSKRWFVAILDLIQGIESLCLNYVMGISYACLIYVLPRQVDGTYARNIENLVEKVCLLARRSDDVHQKQKLRAASLQCLCAMVIWKQGFTMLHLSLRFQFLELSLALCRL